MTRPNTCPRCAGKLAPHCSHQGAGCQWATCLTCKTIYDHAGRSMPIHAPHLPK